jgi:hypothetical protein
MYARCGARRGRADARKVCACGRARGLGHGGYEGYEGYEGYGGDVSALRADGDDATLRDAGYGGYGCKHCVASPCGYAARVWPCPPRGPVVPRWRLRCAWPTGACPPAPRISAIMLGAMGYGGYDGSALRRAE